MLKLPDLSKGHFQGANWKCQSPFLGTRRRGKPAPWSLFKRALIPLARLYPHVLIISQGSTSRILGHIASIHEFVGDTNIHAIEMSDNQRKAVPNGTHLLYRESALFREKQATLLEVSSLSKESVSGAFYCCWRHLFAIISFITLFEHSNHAWAAFDCPRYFYN